jgi:hypothetical protein
LPTLASAVPHLAFQAAEAVRAEPDGQPVGANVDALDQPCNVECLL